MLYTTSSAIARAALESCFQKLGSNATSYYSLIVCDYRNYRRKNLFQLSKFKCLAVSSEHKLISQNDFALIVIEVLSVFVILTING
jgi:hypothetical protein